MPRYDECSYSSLYTSSGHIQCWGQRSCYNSNIYQDSSTTYWLECDGVESRMESIIYIKHQMYIRGIYAVKDSIIYSDNSEINIWLLGAFVGYDSTFVCNNGHTCNVHCYDNNCNDVTLVEIGGTFVIHCYDSTMKSNVCTKGSVLSSFIYEMPNLLNNTIYTSNDDINDNIYLCDNSDECLHLGKLGTVLWHTITGKQGRITSVLHTI